MIWFATLVSASSAFGQTSIYVTDTTGWNAWMKPDGTIMQDAINDQQTGQGADDFAGDTTYAAFAQKAGLINGTTDGILFQTRMNSYQANGLAGYITLGMDLDGNGSIDIMMGIDAKSATKNIKFATAGNGANTSPNTTTWGNFAGGVNLTTSTYNYAQAGTGALGGTPDALVTFGISFADLQTGIRTYAGPAFANFTMSYTSTIAFVAWTTTQQKSINQDMMGYNGKGYEKDTTTYTDLGAITPPMDAYGKVPEPATFVQLGLLLLGGSALMLRRRNVRAKQVSPVASQVAPESTGKLDTVNR
ncbi:MAG: hypothetical protein C0518_14210 [Opitutus sp.]|nr:hypothetical protein [Opitutus sp.]